MYSRDVGPYSSRECSSHWVYRDSYRGGCDSEYVVEVYYARVHEFCGRPKVGEFGDDEDNFVREAPGRLAARERAKQVIFEVAGHSGVCELDDFLGFLGGRHTVGRSRFPSGQQAPGKIVSQKRQQRQ